MKRVLQIAFVLIALTGMAMAQGYGLREHKPGHSAEERPAALDKIAIEQKLDAQLPLDLEFTDEQGSKIKLGDYFQERPVILALVYYECPMLCGETMQGLVSSLGVLKFNAGKEFDVVIASIDPREGAELARNKKNVLLKRYDRPGTEGGWHLLTGSQDSITRLADTVGFRYTYDEKTGQYMHAAAIMIATPQGRLAQYYYGVEYPPKDLRLGLIEASQNKIGNLADQVLLYCFHYDPQKGKYGAAVTNIVRLGGLLTVLVLGTLMFVAYRREPKHSRTTGQA